MEADEAATTLIDVTPIQQPRALDEGKAADAPEDGKEAAGTDQPEGENASGEYLTVECTITEVRDRKGKGPFKIGTGGEGPFEIWDEKLVAKAGACTVCPKRSGANALLFPEEILLSGLNSIGAVYRGVGLYASGVIIIR
jgi:hypothetical protein